MENVELIPVRFAAKYDRMGDGPGEDWALAVLRAAKAEDLITDFKILSVEPGIWGLQYILFTFDAKIPDMSHDEAAVLGSDLAAKIVGETDVYLLFTSSLAGRSAQAIEEPAKSEPTRFERILESHYESLRTTGHSPWIAIAHSYDENMVETITALKDPTTNEVVSNK